MTIAAAPAQPTDIEQAEAALLRPELAPVVEMVLSHDHADPDVYCAAAIDGRVRFRRVADGYGWSFQVEAVEGRNPLADQALDRFAGLATEQAAPHPDRTRNSYPFAYEMVAQLFDHPAAPDLCVVHSSAHYWGERGGHIGEHGSLDVVQAWAPFILAGAGVARHGLVDQGCKLIDVAPTVARLLGVAPCQGVGLNGRPRPDALLARQDGEVQAQMLEPGADPPSHLVGFLFDGANANVLYDLAASGDAPNVARLMGMGTSLRFGAMSSLPTVTLANHTSILTGAHPGHHGVLHNAWWDRARQQQVITNSPATWVTSMDSLFDGIETLHHAVKRTWPDEVTISVNEPCDSGADYSTFGVMRAGEKIDRPPAPEDLPHTTQMFVRPVKEYRWSSLVDHTGVEQAVGIWSGSHRGREWPAPKFTWVNFSLTDAAFHEGGPYSDIARAAVHDTDARLGEVLAAVERAGVFDRAAFFLVADHGMEAANPDVTGDWAPTLEEAGVAYRDEAYGFVYVNP